MRATSLVTLGLCLVTQLTTSSLFSTSATPQTAPQVSSETANKQNSTFNAFTGKIIRNKVRMRLQPNLDGSILRELNRNDMVIVTGESDDFYIVKAPSDVKGYVYRTFILDDIVEGERVNVRLEPDTTSPIIAQLHAGERIKSTVSSIDKKWLEITPPSNTSFYVCKDYVEKIGDPELMTTLERRREEVTDLLNDAYLASQQELQKPYEQINLDKIVANLNTIINDYSDFPAQAGRAKEVLAATQENYLLKKVSYMEGKMSLPVATNNSRVPVEKTTNQHSSPTVAPSVSSNANNFSNATTYSMNRWSNIEQQIYNEWAKSHSNSSIDEFYREQKENAVTLQGVIEPYNRSVKNKPGDYLLVSQANHLPIAYLYSSNINLDTQIGHEVTIHASPRDNHNFAFPAYYVLAVE